MCCFSNLKRNMKSCRCFSDRGNEGWHIATMKGSCKARFQKSRSTAFGKRKVFNTRLMFCPRMLRVQRHPPHPPRFQVFVDPPSLVDTGKKVEEVDARAVRQLDLCLRVHAKIASGEYPSPPPGILSGPVCSISSGFVVRADGRPDVSRRSRVSATSEHEALDTAHATADENKGIVGLHEVNESGSFMTEAVVVSATAGESKGLDELLEVNESDCFRTDAADTAAPAGVRKDIVGLHVVDESDESEFPPLPNSSHAHNSCLRLSTSACARASCFAGACAGAARVCPVSSSSAVSAVVHAHATTLHGAHNSWSDTGRVKGPTGRRCTKGGVSGPAEDLRPVPKVEAG